MYFKIVWYIFFYNFVFYLSCAPAQAVHSRFSPSQTHPQTRRARSSAHPLQRSGPVGALTGIGGVGVKQRRTYSAPDQAGLWSSDPMYTPDPLWRNHHEFFGLHPEVCRTVVCSLQHFSNILDRSHPLMYNIISSKQNSKIYYVWCPHFTEVE